MSWAFSVNVLGFFEVRPLQSRPYETRNFALERGMGAPGGTKLSLRSQWGSGFATRRFAPPPTGSFDLVLSPRGPPLNLKKKVWTGLQFFLGNSTDICVKIGQVWTSLDKFRRVWTSLDRFGQVWTSLDKFGQV